MTLAGWLVVILVVVLIVHLPDDELYHTIWSHLKDLVYAGNEIKS